MVGRSVSSLLLLLLSHAIYLFIVFMRISSHIFMAIYRSPDRWCRLQDCWLLLLRLPLTAATCRFFYAPPVCMHPVMLTLIQIRVCWFSGSRIYMYAQPTRTGVTLSSHLPLWTLLFYSVNLSCHLYPRKFKDGLKHMAGPIPHTTELAPTR